MGFVNTLKAAIGNRVLKGNPVKVNPTSQSLVRHESLRGSALSERVVPLTYGVCTAEAHFRLMVIGLRHHRHRGRAHDAAPSVAASTEVSAMGSRATMTVPLPSELISKLPPSCRILSRGLRLARCDLGELVQARYLFQARYRRRLKNGER